MAVPACFQLTKGWLPLRLRSNIEPFDHAVYSAVSVQALMIGFGLF